jgi:DNA-binding NarL/FixJ family response regulator
MTQPARVLILDDDRTTLVLIEATLQKTFPGLYIEKRATPTPSPGFDIYFVDNDFDGLEAGANVARAIRSMAPEAMIIAFSGTLTRSVLKELINAGCNGACDKTVRQDLIDAMRIVGKFLDERAERLGENTGVMGAVRSITTLLKSWNERLDQQEAQLDQIRK